MTKLTKENLDELIGQRIEIFKNVDEAVSKYNAEQETIKEYNGRQILELIQNADDAGAKTISITLNTERKELVFSNDGVAFDFEGIKSIMIANLSSKITATYIGNKGLGFRSILNWAQSVTIYSAGLGIEFSRKVLEGYLENEMLSLKSNLNEIRKSRNLPSTCIPVPILGLPRVYESTYDGCTEDKGCALKIIYDKSKQDDIINQIKAIDERTLLFLPNINSVDVVIDTETFCISDNNCEWEIHKKEDELPEKYQDKSKNEKKKYIVSIAIPKSGLLESSNPLYNYLPSKERVDLPFLLHATVELNSSRNHVNKSEENDFILRKAAELVGEVAQDKLDQTKNQSDWLAYRIMTPTVQEKDYGSLAALYAKLDEIKKEMVIYPTIDNQYASISEYCYYNDNISLFWIEFGTKDSLFSKMLQPVGSELKIGSRILSNFVEAITKVSKSIVDAEKRVSLIRHIYDCKETYIISNNNIPILIDTNDNIIEGEAYIQDNGDSELTKNIPSWITFKVVQPSFSERLIKEFKVEIDQAKQQKKQDEQQNTSDVRCLVGLLDFFVNIHYFDKARIANQVVSQINAKSEDIQIDERTMIGRMLDYLYNLGSDAKLKNVNLLNENGDVMKADDLMLPTKTNKSVFEGTDTKYVLSLNGWKNKGFLLGLNEWEFEDFMLRLGVNRLLNEKKLKDLFYNGYNDYLYSHKIFNYKIIGQSVIDLIKGSSDIPIQVLRDSIMEKLKHISLNKIMLFLSSYNEVFECLKKSITLKFFYNRNWMPMSTPYNYVRYQISSLASIKWKVFSADLILDDTVDLDCLKPNNRHIIDAIELIRTDFYYESLADIRNFFNDYASRVPDGKNIRELYKLLIDGLTNSEGSIGEIQLYASDVDGNKGYHPSTEVFYSDNTCMPKNVIKDFNLFRLDYPSRQGADKINKIFGLRQLNNLDFKIVTKQDCFFNKEFDSFWKKLKPYFLLYAIQNTTKQSSKKTISGYIKDCSVHLVSQCKYSINDGTVKDLDEGEFINEGNVYYLNVKGISDIEEMKSSITYCNAVADILGMIFKLETKNEIFIHVFQNFNFMKKYIEESRKDEIDECFKLLGMSNEEYKFWERYGMLKGLSLDFENMNFYSRYGSELGFNEQDVKRVNFSNWNNKESVQFLKKILEKLDTNEQRNQILSIVNLSDWHKSRFNGLKTEYNRAFVHELWTRLNDEQCQDKRHLFFSIQNEYSHIEFNGNWEHEMKEEGDYLSYLNDRITSLFRINGLGSAVDLKNDSEKIEHSNLYKNLIRTIQEEKDMEDQRWWLYFEGYEDKIKEYKCSLKKEETEDVNEPNISIPIDGEFVDVRVVEKPCHISTNKGGNKCYTHNSNDDIQKVNAGTSAEKKVDDFLREKEKEGYCKYGEWVSKRDDSAGYDFAYTIEDQQRYLDAKKSSNNTFIITANEYKVAIENKDIYDIAIVNNDGKVNVYRSFFLGSPHIEPKDYYVSFDVKKE